MIQSNSATCEDRYPQIFDRLSAVVTAPCARVLSFGCSTGEEVRVLRRRRPSWEVHSVDMQLQNIETARRHRVGDDDSKEVYAQTTSQLGVPPLFYDVILAMSVLCCFPLPDDCALQYLSKHFPFSRFESVIAELDAGALECAVRLQRHRDICSLALRGL